MCCHPFSQHSRVHVRKHERKSAASRGKDITRSGGHAYLGVAVDDVVLGAGVAHTADSELHVGYAVRSVDPHASYTPRLMQSARPTLSKAAA